jgi:uncharacterized protein YcfJ
VRRWTDSPLIVGALAGALVGGVVGAAVFGGVELGSLAEWASGVGTVGALYFTYQLLKHETETRRRDEAEAIARQASQVSVVALW